MTSQNPDCPYCGKTSVLTSSREVYGGRNFGPIYLCKCLPGYAYVGCHKDTIKPLGRLADKELRYWKKEAHAAFDPLWKSKKMKRGHAYGWLAEQLGISKEECHIGMFDVATCERVKYLCIAKMNSLAQNHQ
ncbi:zinc-finger-containing protein [Aeromonas caviae]|uniref:zinc-finger-containing protein n=1 Tax=Aeromonas caviae TaxID=648 RepID=UPI003858D2E7